MKPEDLIYGKHNFNRYGTVKSFVSNLFTEVTDSDEMCKILNDFSKEINELKSDYLTGEDEELDDVIENVSSAYNDNLEFFMVYWKINKELH